MTNHNTISCILLIKHPLPYKTEKVKKTIESIYNQTSQKLEIILVEHLSKNKDSPLTVDFKNMENEGNIRNFIHLKGTYINRAQMLNKALSQASGEHIMLILSDTSHIVLKESAVEVLSFAMERDKETAFVYSDYALKDLLENLKEIHLLDYHNGRLRDNIDFGKVFYLKKSCLNEISNFDEILKYGEIYDVRLKLSEKYHLKLISNRYNGSLYTIEAPDKAHNVFDYLLMSKESQIEMENILTDHLKRIRAYLPLDFNYHTINYEKNEEGQFKECIATVIIPVNNRPEFIRIAIDSVLLQTIKNIEVIVVVNGGKDDPTIPKVQEYMERGNKYDSRVKLIIHDINNIGLCLNSGLKAARGKYYIQLDSDDRLKPYAVEKIIAEYEKNNKVGMVIGSYEVWEKKDDGTIVRCENISIVTHDEWTYENGRNNLLRINGAGAPRSFHIKIAKEMGWFSINDEPYSRNYGEDYDMVLKISEKYIIGRIWEPIYEVIRHKGGTDHSINQETIDRNDNAKDYMRLSALNRRKILC